MGAELDNETFRFVVNGPGQQEGVSHLCETPSVPVELNGIEPSAS